MQSSWQELNDSRDHYGSESGKWGFHSPIPGMGHEPDLHHLYKRADGAQAEEANSTSVLHAVTDSWTLEGLKCT